MPKSQSSKEGNPDLPSPLFSLIFCQHPIPLVKVSWKSEVREVQVAQKTEIRHPGYRIKLGIDQEGKIEKN